MKKTIIAVATLATLALTELWGMTRDKEEDDVIQKAIEAAVDACAAEGVKVGGTAVSEQRTRDTFANSGSLVRRYNA